MTREDLWENWADPSGWCEYMERGYPLEQTKKDFFKDLDAYYDNRLVHHAQKFINMFKKGLK
jgi:hypothetical protein